MSKPDVSKAWWILAGFFLACSGTQAAPSLTQTKTLSFSFHPSDVLVESVGEFTRIELKDAYPAETAPGAPWLPEKNINILLPPGARPKDIRVTADESLFLTGVMIYPFQPPVPTAYAPPGFVPPDHGIYASAQKIPAQSAELGSVHTMRGFRFVSVKINPLRYNPAAQELYLATHIVITLTFERPAAAPGLSARARHSKGQQLFSRIVGETVDNPDEIASSYESSSDEVSPRPMDVSGDVDYLIITGSACSNAFQELADHRAGYNALSTRVVTTDQIYTDYPGADSQQKIRACVLDFYTNHNLAYVVLGGDDTIVPDRNCYISANGETASDMPTDLYYGGLDSTWDEDGDGTYGEVNYSGSLDEGDLAYDVIVGRIPIRTAAQAQDYIRKVINYETNALPVGFRGKMMIAGEHLGTSYYTPYTTNNRPTDVMYDGHAAFTNANHPSVSDTEMWARRLYRDKVQPFWSATTLGCFFDTLTSWDTTTAGDYLQDATRFSARLNEGWHYLYWNTHGSYSSASLESGSYGTSNAGGLTNRVAFIYSGSCQVGGFDYAVDPCFSEAFLRNAVGGALVFLGCSRYGWYSPDDPPATSTSQGGPSSKWAREFYVKVLSNKYYTAGQAFVQHKASFISVSGDGNWDRWLQFGMNFQGDPLLYLGVNASVRILASDFYACEPGPTTNNAEFIISRAPATEGDLTVHFAVSGTASNGADYVALPGSVVISNGLSSTIIQIIPLANAPDEPDETVTLALQGNPNYDLDSASNATVTIVGEQTSVLQFSPASAQAVENGDPAVLEVIRTGGSTGAASAVCSTLDGSAIAGSDYTAADIPVSLPAGVLSTSITISLVNDAEPEDPELFSAYLHDPSGATLGSVSTAAVTVVDDDQRRARLPFSDGFEATDLSNVWAAVSTGSGRIQVTTANTPHSGGRHVTMDTSISGYALNELTLYASLAGKSNVILRFWQKEFSDEDNEMPATFTGHTNADGVAMSANGVNWYRIQVLTGTNTSLSYRKFTLPLDYFTAAYGLTYTNGFQIKFQQYDNSAITSDGFAFDDVELFEDVAAPSVPTNLRATAQTRYTLTIAWNAVTDNVAVVGYRVYRNGSQVGLTTGTSFTNTGLNPNTAYDCQVRAVDEYLNESSLSSTLTATTAVNMLPVVPDLFPVDGAEYVGHENVNFIGKSFDPEEGPLTNVVWNSSAVGLFAWGTNTTVNTLPVGSHSISASSIDGDGVTGTSAVRVITILADAAANGLPDDWETGYWGDTSSSGGQAGDFDGDGMNNYAEWLAGTDPTNSASTFETDTLPDEEVTGNVISWPYLPNRLYSVYYTTNLFSPNLELLVENYPSGVYTDTVHDAEINIYYRVKITKP